MQRSRLVVDPLSGREVLIAPARRGVPRAGSECVFCPGAESSTGPEVARSETPWLARAFHNLYPIVTPADAALEEALGGAHEVLTSASHVERLTEIPPHELAALCELLGERERAHASWRHVSMLGNLGAAAGASQPHPHLQLVALDHEPEIILAESQRLAGDECAICGLDAPAILEGTLRVLAAPAPRIAYELLLAPDTHAETWGEWVRGRGTLAAEVLQQAVGLLEAVGARGVTLVWHSGVGHWHLHVIPRWAPAAGFEMGTMAVASVSPEETCEQLRSLLGR